MCNFIKDFKELLEKYDASIIPIISQERNEYELAIRFKNSDGLYRYKHFTDIPMLSAFDCERFLND